MSVCSEASGCQAWQSTHSGLPKTLETVRVHFFSSGVVSNDQFNFKYQTLTLVRNTSLRETSSSVAPEEKNMTCKLFRSFL